MLECPVCGRSACCPIFHKRELQLRYAPAIEAFEQARAIRARIDAELDREAELAERAPRAYHVRLGDEL
ncbi:hypothetical protein [Burkholderia gladioli]|uniref:hypothetical protein n=1 Tax=Burkholderia gladioli TaxID=28095 RepID=UPI00163F67F4|nr:hypothetical protein [Burkholderia gladioli]